MSSENARMKETTEDSERASSSRIRIISIIPDIFARILGTRRKKEIRELEAPRKTWGEIATPFLRIDAPDPWFDRSLIAPPNDTCQVSVSVRNEGNATSYFTVIDLYEGPPMYIAPDRIKDCELRDRKIITLHPGEEKQLKLKYTRKLSAGQAIGICYDPFLDPKIFEHGIGFLAPDRKNIFHAVRYGFAT